MNNLNSILDYLKVFNNINKRPAYEPRTMAQEPRNMYAGGQLVQNTVDGSRPGYGGDETFLVKVGNPKKLKNVIEQEFIEVTGSKNRPETYKKTGVKKTLYKPQIIVGNKTVLTTDFGTKEAATAAVEKYRIKNPIKNAPPDLETMEAKKKKKYLDKLKKAEAIKIKGGYYSGPYTGTNKTHKSHAGNVWGTEKITGGNVGYASAEINKAMEAGLDHKIRKVSEKMEKIKKQKIPAAMKKKLLEEVDTTLIRLASQSQGFKKITLSDGSTFGGGRLTIDPFNEFPGWTEREINEFVKKWHDEKIITEEMVKKNPKLKVTTLEDFNNIKKANFFEINRKNALKAASKIGKKEQQKIISEFNKKFIKLGCGMYAGGRVGFKVGSGKCINRAIAKLKSGNLSAAEKKIVDAMGDGLKKSGMPKKFWTMKNLVKGEGYFALADFANNLTKGQTLDKSFSNAIESATFGILDLGGNERDLMNYAKERGLNTKDMKEWMDYAQTYNKYIKGHQDLKWAKKTKEAGGEFTPSHILNPEAYIGKEDEVEQAKSVIEKAKSQLEEKGKSKTLQSGKGYKDMNEMIEGVVAKEWNKPAGIAGLDRGFRKMLGMKGDEGMVWGPIGNLFREGAEKLGFDEHDALKGFKPQTVMNYHPAYGYKEDIKDVIREGDSPMEDMLEFMKKNFPSTALRDEALRTKKENLKEKEQWVDTGFGRKKRKVKKDMGTYDYDPNLAEGGIASLKKYYD